MAKTTSTTKTLHADATILRNPRITEKAARAAEHNTYVFEIAVGATKSEVAKAFQAAYKHKPLRVNIVNEKAKSYFRRGVLGFGKRGKKAYITLPKGATIEIM